MAKEKIAYVCNSCGSSAPKWQGQCPSCEAWNTLSEQRVTAVTGRALGFAGDRRSEPLGAVEGGVEARVSTGLVELDRVLGGGLVPSSAILIGGDPGIGKSTLLLQATVSLANAMPVLYVTGEESLQQVSMRAQRLGLSAEGVHALAETNVERILAEAAGTRPKAMVIDSIQTLFAADLSAAPGTVSQLRECAAQLVRHAKQSGTAVFLVGHVTKEGVIAGPRVLEHMVDTVLNFESDTGSRFRILRAGKNRFGAANEIGVFAMTDTGLKEVRNPSAIFLSRHREPVPGSLVMVAREGTRPLLVEVQALADESAGQAPRRVTVGLEGNRLGMLLAVLNRHAGVVTYGQDVFVNVVGGVRVAEPAADLPALLAVVSSVRDRPLPDDTVAFGEVGLAGEIRPVPFGEERLREAAKHGFKTAICPAGNRPKTAIEGLKVHAVDRLAQAIDLA